MCVFVHLEEFEVSGLRGIVEVLMEIELEARNLLFFFFKQCSVVFVAKTHRVYYF